MDREKLEKASFDFVLSENKYPESACGYLQEVFQSGAEWLQSQPLSERLTEDERENIKNLYNSEVDSMELENGRVKNAQSQIEQLCHESNFWQAKLKADMLESIFGKEMFENKD